MKFKLLVNIFYLLLMIIGWTSKKIFINKKIKDDFEKNNIPIIYAFWHNRIIYLAYLYRNTYTAVMVSQHRDGDFISAVMKKIGLVPIRGSTTRGGIKALIEIINYLKKTKNAIAFTPDGPRGPKYTIQEGVLIAAKKTGSPIVPVCWSAKHKIIFNSWDNFILPLPFNTFYVAYGEPVWINKNDNIIQKKNELYKKMMDTLNLVEKINLC